MIYSPLAQFELDSILLINIFNVNTGINLLNITLFIIIVGFGWIISLINNLEISNISFLFTSESFLLPYQMAVKEIGIKLARNVYYYYASIFILVWLLNNLGNIVYSFAITSEFFLTFFISWTTLVSHIILGIFIYQFYYIALFLPEGTPLFFAPLISLLEFVSNLARLVSLGTRLAANLLSGHITIKLLASLALTLFNSHLFLGLALFMLVLIAIQLLEILVASLQAYVLGLLSYIYLSEIA